MKAKLPMKKIEKMKNLIRKILRIKKNKKSISPNIFPKLHNYILSKMQMSHIYQPLMLIELIKGDGKANRRDIAKSILSFDEAQIDYYKKIIQSMPFKYLSKHLDEIKKKKGRVLH